MPRMTDTPKSNETRITFNPKRFREFIQYARKEGEKTKNEIPSLAATAREIVHFVLDIYFSEKMQKVREMDGSSTLEFIKRSTIMELNRLTKGRMRS